jgi:hypothetical protein
VTHNSLIHPLRPGCKLLAAMFFFHASKILSDSPHRTFITWDPQYWPLAATSRHLGRSSDETSSMQNYPLPLRSCKNWLHTSLLQLNWLHTYAKILRRTRSKYNCWLAIKRDKWPACNLHQRWERALRVVKAFHARIFGVRRHRLPPDAGKWLQP